MKKKLLSMLCVVALMLSLLPITAFAADDFTLGLSASATVGTTDIERNLSDLRPGDTVTVKITVPASIPLCAAQVKLTFDKERFELAKGGIVTGYAPSYSSSSSVPGWDEANNTGRTVANTNGYFSTANTASFYDNDEGQKITANAVNASKWDIATLTFTVKSAAPVGSALFAIATGSENLAFSNEKDNSTTAYTVGVPEAISATVVQEISSVALSGSVTTPSKGGTDSSSITEGTGYTGTVTWSPELSGGKFAANTAYTATVTLTPKTGYVFADGMTVTGLDGYTFTKSGSNYVASKTFTATATKALSALVVTTAPTKTTYTHGDTFDKTGMVVKATYDDASVDTAFTDYTVNYQNGSYLKKGDTKVTLRSGDQTVDVTGLTVAAKQLSVTGLTATNRAYDGTTGVALSGGTLNGVVGSEAVTAAMPTAGTISDANVGSGKAVNFTDIALSGTDAGNYTLQQPMVKVNISKADLSVQAENKSAAYGDSAPTYTVQYSGFVGSEDQSVLGGTLGFDCTYAEGSAVGSYDIMPKGLTSDNYEIAFAKGTLTVSPKTVTAPTFSGVADAEYTGSAITPTVELKDGITTIPTTEYNVEFSNNTNVGTATITVTDKEGGNYSVSGTKTFEITAHSVNGKTAYVTSTATQNVVTGIGTFTEPTFKDTRETANATIPGTVTYSYGSVVDGNAAAVAAVLKELAKGATGTITWTFTPSGGNYTGTLNGSIAFTMVDIEFKVGDVAATDANAFPNAKASPVYGDTWGTILGTQATLTAKVDTATDNTAAHFAIKVDGTTYDASAVPTAGNHVVTVVYNGEIGGKTYNNVVAVTKNVSVGKAALTVTAEAKTATYGDATPEYTVTYSGFVNSETKDVLGGTLTFDCTYAKNSAVGNYDITPKGLTSSNYEITFTKNTLTVGAKTLTEDMVTVGGPLNYTASEQTVSVTVTDSDATITSGDYDVTGNKGTDVGDYTVTITAKGNYTGSVTQKFTIAKKPITPTIDVTGSYKFTGSAITPTFTVKDSATVLSETDYTAKITDAVNAGTGTITITEKADGNYTFSTATQTFAIGKADALTLLPVEINQKYTVADGEKLLENIMPANAGTLTYDKNGSESKTGSVIVTSWGVDASGKVTFNLSGGAAGDTVTLPVSISSANYADTTVEVVITLTEKDAQAALTLTGGTTVTYGETLTLGTTGGSGTGDVTYVVTPGTGTATVSGNVLTATKAGTVTVKAVKAADVDYNKAESTPVTITIDKATPTGTPAYTKITASGKTLADAALTAGTIDPAGGIIVWDLSDTQEVTANTSYNWTYTPTDTVNYNNLTGSITPYRVSSGGGEPTSYAISVEEAEYGSVSADVKTAASGKTVTLTVTPDKGYTLETITATDKGGKEIELTNVKAGESYTFKMPAGAVTVHATFMEDNYLLNFFVDVNAQDYFYDAVYWAVQNGITNGIDDFHFDPNADCTRAQVVTFLWRAAGCPAASGVSFQDVKADSYYAEAVAWAVANGITNGTSDTTFSPDATCTRGQIVTFLARFAEGKAASATNPFTDVKDGQFYSDAVLWAVEAGVTTGTSASTFSPDVTCTRAQAVTFLYRYMGE